MNSEPSNMSKEDADIEIRKYFKELSEIQRELIGIYSEILQANSSDYLECRKKISDLEKKYESISEDVTLAIESSFSIGTFEDSDRFSGTLNDKTVMSLSVSKYREPIATHTGRIERLAGSVEQALSSKRQQLVTKSVLIVSFIAVLISIFSIVLQIIF